MADTNDKSSSSYNGNSLGIPGMTIQTNVATQADAYGVFIPDNPRCPVCGCYGEPDGYYKERTVWHLLTDEDGPRVEAEGHPIVISVEYKRQRFKCPKCSYIGKKAVIPYEPDFIKSRSTTTNALNDYIGQLSLDNSPQKVADVLGVLGKSTVENIFKRWAEEHINEYTSKLIAPVALGLHMLTVNGVCYYLITDIEDELLLDVFEESDFAGMMERLTKLAAVQMTREVLTEIKRLWLVTVRGIFRNDAFLCAATASICRTYANAVISEMDQRYSGRGNRAISAWLLSPLFEDLPIEPEVNRVIQQGAGGHNAWLRSMLLNYRKLRYLALQSWNKKEFDDWRAGAPALNQLLHSFSDALAFADEEVDHSFSTEPAQNAYLDVEERITDIIQRNQKCAFDLLRARILLKCNPEITSFFDVNLNTRFYYYRGVSLRKLQANLPDYKE